MIQSITPSGGAHRHLLVNHAKKLGGNAIVGDAYAVLNQETFTQTGGSALEEARQQDLVVHLCAFNKEPAYTILLIQPTLEAPQSGRRQVGGVVELVFRGKRACLVVQEH